jgi:hypothetical protein
VPRVFRPESNRRVLCRTPFSFWIGNDVADVIADLVVILRVLRENRNDFLSKWTHGNPFLFLVGKQWLYKRLHLCQQRISLT